MNDASSRVTPITSRLEDRWLLAAAQTVLLESKLEVAPPAEGVDWEFLLRQASLHALGPCLTRYCEERADEVPPSVLERMRQELVAVRAYNFYLQQELVRVTGLLVAGKVQVAAWKGPALAAMAYPDAALRQSADLDLLVPPSQMAKALEILTANGYHEVDADTGGHTRNLERTAPKTVVEVHGLAVQSYFSVPWQTDDILEEGNTVSTMTGEIPVPSPEKLLLLLCLHGGKHVWERLIWICDLVLLIRATPDMDWGKLWDLAVKCRSERMLGLGLVLADAMESGVVPEEQIRRSMADSVVVKLAKQSYLWLFVTKFTHATSLRRTLYQIALREAWADKKVLISHHLKMALTPSQADRDFLPLPRVFGFAYFAIRPVRLVIKAAYSAIIRH